MAFNWTDDRLSTMKRMFRAKASASEIADALGDGLSRNAVCGKLHRMGLMRGNAVRAARAVKPKLDRKRIEDRRSVGVGAQVQAINRAPPVKIEPIICQDAADVLPLHLCIHDLTDATCKWPYGTGPYTFCGNTTRGEKLPYCPAHVRLSRGVGTVSERAAARLTEEQAAS